MDEREFRVEISRMHFLCKVTVGVNMIYFSTSVSDSMLTDKIAWTVCKWDLLVLRMEPALYHLRLLVSLSAWLPDEASILQCFAQLDVHPFSPLGFVHLSTSLPIICYSFIALRLVASCQNVFHPAAKHFYLSLDF